MERDLCFPVSVYCALPVGGANVAGASNNRQPARRIVEEEEEEQDVASNLRSCRLLNMNKPV